MGISRTISEVDGDIKKIAKFSHLRVFGEPLTGFPLELSIGATGQKTRIMGLPVGRKSFKIGLAV